MRTVSLCLLLVGAAPLRAQGLDPERELAGPSIKLGETDLYPSLRLDALRTDNIFRTSSDEQEGSAVLVSPRLVWLARRRLLTVQGSYEGEYARSDEPVLEHTDHHLRLGIRATPGKRWSGDGAIVYRRGHLEPGIYFAEALGDTLDEPAIYDQFEVLANGRYGAAGARGNLGFGLRAFGRSYTNLESLTDRRDYAFVEPYGRFSVRVAGDTRLFVELRAATVDRKENTLDRDALSAFGGVSFAVTERTGSEFQLGVTSSNYDDARIEDETTFVAEGILRYDPRDYSRLRLLLRRAVDDAAGTALAATNAAVRTFARLDWEYDWSERVSQSAFGEFEDIDRGCSAVSETSSTLGLELAFGVRRWLDLGAVAGAASRTGDVCAGTEADAVGDLDYDLVNFGLFVRARL